MNTVLMAPYEYDVADVALSECFPSKQMCQINSIFVRLYGQRLSFCNVASGGAIKQVSFLLDHLIYKLTHEPSAQVN